MNVRHKRSSFGTPPVFCCRKKARGATGSAWIPRHRQRAVSTYAADVGRVALAVVENVLSLFASGDPSSASIGVRDAGSDNPAMSEVVSLRTACLEIALTSPADPRR